MTSRWWKTFTGFSRDLLQLTILHVICDRNVHGLCPSMVPGPANSIDAQNPSAPSVIGVTSDATCQQWCLSSSVCVAVEFDQINSLCKKYTSVNGYSSHIANQFARYEKQFFTCPTTAGTTRLVTPTARPTTVQQTTPQVTPHISERWVSTGSNASHQPSVPSTVPVSHSSTTPLYVYIPPSPKPLEAPGAAAFGVMAIIFLIAEISFLVILDIRHLSRDCIRGVRNARRGLGRCRNKGEFKEVKVKGVNQSTMELNLHDKPLRQVPPTAAVTTTLRKQQSPNIRSSETNSPSSNQRIILLLGSNTQVTDTASLKENIVESSTHKSGRRTKSRSVASPKTQIAKKTTQGPPVKESVAANHPSTTSPNMTSSKTSSPAQGTIASKENVVEYSTLESGRRTKSKSSPKTQMAEKTTSGFFAKKYVASNHLSTTSPTMDSSRIPSPVRRTTVSHVVFEPTKVSTRKKKKTKSSAVKLQNSNAVSESNQPASDTVQSSNL